MKAFQWYPPTGEENRWTWHEFCRQTAANTKDPSLHSLESLQEFDALVNLTAWYWESFKPWKKTWKTPPSSPVQLSSAGHEDDDECWGSWTGSNISRQDSKKDWSNSTQDSKKGWWDHNWGWDQKHDWSQEKEAWGWDQKHDWHVRSQMEVASKELSARKRKAAADLINIDKAQRCLQEARDLMS